MYKELEQFLNSNPNITILDLSKEIGVSRQTVYVWKRKQEIPNDKIEKVRRFIENNSHNKETLFKEKTNALYSWREEKAKEKNTLPTLILSNASLNLLSYTTINNKKDILNIKGIGLNKYNEYGEELYELLIKESVKIDLSINFEFNYSSKEILLINKNDEIILKNDELFINDNPIKEYIISFNDKYLKNNNLNNLKFNIIRYETVINIKKQKIEYTIFCSEQPLKKDINKYVSNFKDKYKNKLLYNNPLFITAEFDFKDVVSYIKAGELDIVLEITKEEMESLRKYKLNREINDETLGLYIKYTNHIYDDLKDKLGDKITNEIDRYKGYYNYLNIILICNENINNRLNSWIDNNYEELKQVSRTINKKGNLFSILDFKRIVFIHELGHLIFSYNESYSGLEEKQANYIVSNYFDGKYDYFINFMVKFQNNMYQNPLLKPEIDYILNDKYEDINNMYNTYNKEVNSLYE